MLECGKYSLEILTEIIDSGKNVSRILKLKLECLKK